MKQQHLLQRCPIPQKQPRLFDGYVCRCSPLARRYIYYFEIDSFDSKKRKQISKIKNELKEVECLLQILNFKVVEEKE